MDKAADKLDKGPKSKNPDVDDQGLTRSRADVVRQGNIVSKDAEKVRRRYAAGNRRPLMLDKEDENRVVLVELIELLQNRVTHMISIVKMKRAQG